VLRAVIWVFQRAKGMVVSRSCDPQEHRVDSTSAHISACAPIPADGDAWFIGKMPEMQCFFKSGGIF